MDDANPREVLVEHKRASLLGLPAELRLQIYHEVFRIRSWEAHQSRVLDVSAPKRILSDQCPVCQRVAQDRTYLYPAVRVFVCHGDALLPPHCFDVSSSTELLNRSALLRVNWALYKDAGAHLYASTPFMVFVTEDSEEGLFQQDCTGPNMKSLGVFLFSYTPILLPKIRNLYLRVDWRDGADALVNEVREIMNSVWSSRGFAKVHVDLPDRGSPQTSRVLLTVGGQDSSPLPLRALVYRYNLGPNLPLDPDTCCSVLLGHTLPRHLLRQINADGNIEKRSDGLCDLDSLLAAVKMAQQDRDDTSEGRNSR